MDSPVGQLRASLTAGIKAADLVPTMIYFLAQRRKALEEIGGKKNKVMVMLPSSNGDSSAGMKALFRHSLYQVFLYILTRFPKLDEEAEAEEKKATSKKKTSFAPMMMMRGRRTVVGACRGGYHTSCPSGTSDAVKADFDQVSHWLAK